MLQAAWMGNGFHQVVKLAVGSNDAAVGDDGAVYFFNIFFCFCEEG